MTFGRKEEKQVRNYGLSHGDLRRGRSHLYHTEMRSAPAKTDSIRPLHTIDVAQLKSPLPDWRMSGNEQIGPEHQIHVPFRLFGFVQSHQFSRLTACCSPQATSSFSSCG